YAVWYAGLTAVPMNAKLHQREFAYILDNAEARLCFATPDLVETVALLTAEVASLDAVIATGDAAYQTFCTGPDVPMRDVAPEAIGLALLYEWHHGTAKARHADAPEPAGHDPERFCRYRRHYAGRLHDPRRTHVARFGPVRPATRGQGGVSSHSGEWGRAHWRARGPNRDVPGRHVFLCADHGDPSGQSFCCARHGHPPPQDADLG